MIRTCALVALSLFASAIGDPVGQRGILDSHLDVRVRRDLDRVRASPLLRNTVVQTESDRLGLELGEGAAAAARRCGRRRAAGGHAREGVVRVCLVE
jgi:hypothetical protein